MWHRQWTIVGRLLVLTWLVKFQPSNVSAADDGTSNLTVAQCVLVLGGYDTNADQLINRTEFAGVVNEFCTTSSSSYENAIWETVFLEAACLCRSFDGNNATSTSSEDCCSVNPVIRRPGQYAKEYTIAVCSFLYQQFAHYNCSTAGSSDNATETPTAAPISLIIFTTESPAVQSPTRSPLRSSGNVAIVDNNTFGNKNDDSLAPWMLALLVLLAAASTVLLIWTLQRTSCCSLSSSADRSQAMTVAKGSVQIRKSSDDEDDVETKKKKKQVVVVVVNDPTSFSTSSYDENGDEERALPRKDSVSTGASNTKTTTPKKNYYVDTDHDLMYASHQYFSSPTTKSPAEKNRSNPLPEEEDDDDKDDVILEDCSSSSSSSSSDPFHVAPSQSSSSSSSSTSSQGDPSSVAALLSEPLPMSVLYDDASFGIEPHRRPSTIQTTIFEDNDNLGTHPLPSALPDPAWNPGVTMGRSLASGAATLHISPSLPDYGIVQFTEFPVSEDAVVDVDDQTVVASNRPPNSSSHTEEGWLEENTPPVPVDISQPVRKGRTATKQRSRPLPARV